MVVILESFILYCVVVIAATSCSWLPAVLQEFMCHTFQRMLTEPEEPVRLLLWQVIVMTTFNMY